MFLLHVGSMNSHEYKMLLGCWLGSWIPMTYVKNVIFNLVLKCYIESYYFETLETCQGLDLAY